MTEHRIPIVARGEVIEDYELTFNGRYGASFQCPDASKYLDRILLPSRREMEALYALSLDDVLDYLVEFGAHLDLASNPHLQWAAELTRTFNDVPSHLVEGAMAGFGSSFLKRDHLEAMIETVGREHLDGWKAHERANGRISHIRAFGVPTAHVIAGNGPSPAMMTFVRNALVRGYAIVKIPSNELGTAVALARTAIDMAPDHPLTRAFSAVYWRGGDAAFETKLYHPRNVERIVAWGGFASVTHIAKYIRPGIDLVTFDPKISRSILGEGTLASDESMREAAIRLADDVGNGNQNGCTNARIAYVVCDMSEEAIVACKRLGQMVYEEVQNLPSAISSPAIHMDADFKARIAALSMLDDEYHVIGGDERGGVIVSLEGDQVDFADDLKYRTLNLVPVRDYDALLRYVTRDVQTVGVYPEHVRDELRTVLALHGVQRITSLGYMREYNASIDPHDGNEALRKMCTWVVAEDCMTHYSPAQWRQREQAEANRP
ncbi:MAG: long-chain-fatty-acyl-CoA reductase [Novosphingobium sp.]|nr:long-chain-fatty-acyl-CoA reductase [Novosphingobium sp.]